MIIRLGLERMNAEEVIVPQNGLKGIRQLGNERRF
jgi:hypothetical protein